MRPLFVDRRRDPAMERLRILVGSSLLATVLIMQLLAALHSYGP